MRITFYGAAQNVTGSKHLVESGEFRLLLDCGLHQGKRREAYALNKELPFEAKSIDSVIVSHAHADHCGLLPLLVKQGFTQAIYATPATTDIAQLIMMDSAGLQEHDYRMLLEQGTTQNPLPPLYTKIDAEATSRLCVPVPYDRTLQQWTKLNESVRFKLYDAGHILGSAITYLECHEEGSVKTLAYTGDLGNTHVPILREPETIPGTVENLIIESTYGDTNHRPMDDVSALLTDVISKAVAHKQRIIVPAFALGRTQELIYILHQLHNSGRIPAIPIYLDSPLASEITTAFMKHRDEFDEQTYVEFINRSESPFAFQNLHTITTVEESKELMRQSGPYMVIASSGMAEGGRILHHLKHSISDPNTVILLTGFQASETLGRKIQDGISPVRIYDTEYQVRARVLSMGELSAHADQAGLIRYVTSLHGLKRVFLVHGEMTKATALRDVLMKRLPSMEVIIPSVGQTVEL